MKLEKIREKLAIALYWTNLKMTEENFEDAVEIICMEVEEEKIEIDQAVDEWIKNTKINYPEYFIK